MSDKCHSAAIAYVVLISCAAMAFVDGVIEPQYAVKSAVKLVFFVGLPLLYMFLSRDEAMLRMMKPKGKGVATAVAVGIAVYAVIVGGYFALRGVFDFSAVTASLASGEGVTKENFPVVAVYISLCNSAAEEIMFRAFAYGVLRRTLGERAATFFSALAFALYHIAIMSGWFSPVLFALLLIGLMAGGIIFNFADGRADSVYPSWIIHMFANLGINTVGLVLFGIL